MGASSRTRYHAAIMRMLGSPSGHRKARRWPVPLLGVALLLVGCGGGTSATPGWTFGPAIAGTSPAASPSTHAASASSSASTAPSPAASPTALPGSSAAAGSAKPFSGRMSPQVLLVDGFVTMYMELANTGS